MKVKINKQTFHVTECEDKAKGLKGVTNLPENHGMIFIYDDLAERDFWMEDTLIPLLIIGIDEDYIITSIHLGKVKSKKHILFDAKFVVELNKGADVNIGDSLEFSDDFEDNGKMLVLNENADVQMELEGGERIFSRPNTKTLIKFAARAYKTKKDSDYKILGKRVFKYLDIQDNNDPEYVSVKN